MTEEQETCKCPDPALCRRLGKHIFGRLWDIWNGVNIDTKVAQQYRNLWERQAKMGGQPLAATKSEESSAPEPPAEPPKRKGCGCRKRK